MPFLAKKCKESSLVASLRIDFYINKTFAPLLTIFDTNDAVYFRSSLKILSIAA